MLLALNPVNPESNFDLIRAYTGKPVGPVPALESPEKLGQLTQYYATFVSVSAAIKIGFSGFGALDGSLEHKVWISDYAATANQADVDESNGVDSWTYGVGYRLAVLMNKSACQAKASLPAFAAEATLNNAYMLIQVLTYGVPMGPAVPVVDLSQFDVDAYAKYVSWQNEMNHYMRDNRKDLMPILTHAAISTDFQRYLNRLLPMLFALRRLEDRHSFKEALADGARRGGIDVVVLRAVYAQCTGNSEYLRENSSSESALISEAASKYAKSILAYYDQVSH